MPRTLSTETPAKVGAEPPVIPPSQKPKMLWWIIFAALAAILLIGWVVWTYEKTINEAEKLALEQNALELKKQVQQGETADWQTYRNEEYGFEFKYPNDWVISKKLMDYFKEFYPTGEQVSLVKKDQEQKYVNESNVFEDTMCNIDCIGKDGDYIDIRVFFHYSWDEFTDKDYKDTGFGIENVELKTINGIPVKIGKTIKRYEGQRDEVMALFKYPLGSNSKIDSISFDINYNDGNYEKDTFNQILSTFRFINSCFGDNECQPGEVCFNSQLCGELTADGENCGPQLGDLQCHQLCQSDDDCLVEMPKCEENEIWIGDAGLTKKFCVK